MVDLQEVLNDIYEDMSDVGCSEGEVHGWPYHAHHVIGGTEIQLYKGSGNMARGDAGDIMAKRDSWYEDGWKVALNG